jgi:hypothetical protein
MNNYEIKKLPRAFIIPFADYAAAESWAIGYFGDGFTITNLGAVIPPTEAEKLAARQSFGKELLNEYLMDNDLIAKERGYPFTVEETGQQAQKFQLVMGILPLGSLVQCLTVIQNTATDTIFTQARKDKYIASLQTFLNSQS